MCVKKRVCKYNSEWFVFFQKLSQTILFRGIKYEEIKNYAADSMLLTGETYHWITVSKIFAQLTVWQSCSVWHILIAKHINTRVCKMWDHSIESLSFNFCHAIWSIDFKTQLAYNRLIAFHRSCTQSSKETSTRPGTVLFKHNSIHYSMISCPSTLYQLIKDGHTTGEGINLYFRKVCNGRFIACLLCWTPAISWMDHH